ncbi:MAG: serine/threonine-protein kinase [Planctomycetaceae bacterium]
MPSSSEETIFLQAIEIESPQAQLEFLEAACRDQPELLANVKALLVSYARSEFLESTPQAVKALRPVNQSAAPLMLGPYRVIEQIARGGMGSVFLAEQTEPVRRRVAVKIIRPELDSEDIVRRFHLEQRAHALMDHKNIARVLDASTTESGISYFVMEYVDGMPIHHYCRQKQLSVQDRLLLFLDCAHAIQHAHIKGILHRDIKPSNVLVAEQDGKPLVKVIDFGIAKALQQDDAPNVLLQTMGTRLGQVLGTPQFMSPEQASQGTVSTDTRSDVYSLGALLYQLLTDMPPFETQIQKSMAFDEMLRIIRQDDPVRPSQMALKTTSPGTQAPTVSTTKRLWMALKGDLDAIVMKAMEKDPARRYQNAGALIDDVERYLRSQPILARVPSTWYTLAKLAHRRRGLLASMVIAIVCLLTGTVVALIQAEKAHQARLDARVDAQRAIAAEQNTRELLYTQHLKLASSAMENNDPAAALEALSRQRPAGGMADLRSFDWYALTRLNRPKSRTIFRNQASLYSMCLVVATTRIATVGADGIVRVIEPDDGSIVWQKNPGAGELNGVACSPDGKFLSVAGDDGRVIHLHAESGEVHSDFKPHNRQAFQIAWAKDGQFFVTCGNESTAKICRFPNIIIRDIPAARDLECLAVSSQGDIALGSEGGTIYVVDGSKGFEAPPQVQQFVGNERDHCSSVAFSPDGELLASGCLDGTVILYGNRDRGFVPERSIKASESVGSLAFSSDQASLLAGLKNGSVETWPLEEPSEQQFSLWISHQVHAKSGAALLSNQANGYDWASIRIDPNPGRATGKPVAGVDRPKFLQVRRVTPSLVDGYFPKGTTKVSVEFSEPITTDHLSERIRLLRRPHAFNGRRQTALNSLSTSVDGNHVTFVLTGQTSLDKPTSEVQKFHEGDIAALRPSKDHDRIFSVGSDGAVVEFRPEGTEPFHIIDEGVPGFDVGYFGVTWSGELPQQFLGWHQLREHGAVTFLPQSEGFATISVRQSQNAEAIVTYNIRIRDGYMESRLLSNPNDSNHLLLFSPGPVQPDLNASAVSGEARYVAVAYRPRGDTNQPGIIRIKDLQSGESWQIETQLHDIEFQFSPDARSLLVSNQNSMEMHQVPSGLLTKQRTIENLGRCIFSPDGQEILTVGDDGLLQIWSAHDLSLITSINAHDIAARDIAISPDGRTIATVGFDNKLKFWRRSVLELSAEIRFSEPLTDVKFSPDGTTAVVRDDDGTLYLIDARPTDAG